MKTNHLYGVQICNRITGKEYERYLFSYEPLTPVMAELALTRSDYPLEPDFEVVGVYNVYVEPVIWGEEDKKMMDLISQL